MRISVGNPPEVRSCNTANSKNKKQLNANETSI